MASASEVILPIGTQKHDPAWKHCLMIRSGGRTKLKCMYCMKLFLGGGIHRIKEHLAKQKGNASRCQKVPVEVQNAMQESLDGASVRKKKKMKLAEEVKRINPGVGLTHDADELLDPALHMIPLPDVLDSCPAEVAVKEEGVPRVAERGRRRRPRCASPPFVALPPPTQLGMMDVGLPSKASLGSTVDKEQVYMAIGRFLYEAGVPLDAVNSVYFQPMVDAIASAGPGLQLPSYHDFLGCILKRTIEEVNGTLEHYKSTWNRTGCSVLADEWTTDMGKTLINFLIYCPEGMMFLKSVNASHIVSSPHTLYELLKHVVEEVGDRNVVQVITSNTESHVLAGKRLMETFPNLFWTPCSSRCIDAILEDFASKEGISDILDNAKSVTGFIYNHGEVLNMMRKYTNGRELLSSGDSRSAMNFIVLKAMTSLKDELRAMVTSEEWGDCLHSKKEGGLAMASLVGNLKFWSSCMTVVRITDPLVQALRIVESTKRPAMAYIHVAMHQAKEAIRRELVKKSVYMSYWDIIDWRWDRQLSRPLHAAGFFLNPQLFYSIQGEVSNEISSAMLDCIERLIPEAKIQDKIQKELSLYKSAAGDFGRKMAVRARHTLLPAEWWSTYGGACPNLTRLAIRILSQTCSARGCERNHVPFEHIHDQRMNLLEHQRLSDLVYVRYNLRLQQRKLLKNKPYDPVSVDNIDIVDDWIVEKNKLLIGADEDPSWMILEQPLSNSMPSGYSNDEEAEAFISGLDEDVIRGAGQEAEEDDDCKDVAGGHDGNSFTCD